ncbi:transmembrane protein 79 [Esox lucius]|uniref:Transmembrane protein 79b n=1 Tax=Esox lucius TaxID=8010 RepID=A0A3P8ZSI2_ESOLU|nr:transmembrane protein 79 [Esox lucius]
MSEILPTTLCLLEEGTTKTSRVAAEPQTPTWGAEGEKLVEQETVSSAKFEPTTLPWSADRDVGKMLENGGTSTKKVLQGKGEDDPGKETRSLHSMCSTIQGGESRTESERELRLGDDGRKREEQREMERELQESELKKSEEKGQVEIKVEDHINCLPEKAAKVFDPSITILRSFSAPTSPRGREAFWDVDTETSPFLALEGTLPDGYYRDGPVEGRSSQCCCDCVNRDALKVGVSVFTAALIFPLLVWGGYVFLPFDAPLLDSAPLRLVYTLRCSVFAVVPIVLGWLVLGVSRMRSREVKLLCGDKSEAREVGIHRRYVDDSVTLFLLYFLQLAVMAPYLSQAMVKLVPLLTIIFAFGRLTYWVAAAMGSSVRGFGFGLSFLPTVVMLGANLYFIFTMDAEGTIFSQDGVQQQDQTPDGPRQRFWG